MLLYAQSNIMLYTEFMNVSNSKSGAQNHFKNFKWAV